MMSERQKIPLVLKFKRFKNSKLIRRINSFVSGFFPPVRFNGSVKRILIFRNDRIGDAMVTLPVLRDIKRNYPDMIIDVAVSPKNKFIFENAKFVDNLYELNIAAESTPALLKIPVVGGILLFLKYIVIPFIFSSDFRKQLKVLKHNNYDVSADLVGMKRNSLIGKYVSGFTIGPGRLAAFLFYDYYIDSNWVSPFDSDFMTRKIEKALTESLNLVLLKRDKSLPILPQNTKTVPAGEVAGFDIIFHLGSGSLRKLKLSDERSIIDAFKDKKLLITDSRKTPEFESLKNKLADYPNITFMLFETLGEIAQLCSVSKLLFCYDGGQAHFLSQYIRTLTVFGPGSAALWKPYEFEDYEISESDQAGYKVMVSRGAKRHVIVFREIWCSPCFDTGCRTRPCLNELSPELIIRIIKQYCM